MAFGSAGGVTAELEIVALETASNYSDGSYFPLEFNVLAAVNSTIGGAD